MPVKIFLAAVEHNTRHELFNSLGVRYRLLSYYYLRKKSKARIDELFYNTYPKDAVILLDSGAFTWMTSREKDIKNDPSKFWVEIEDYLNDYIQFIRAHRSRIYAAAEMDLDRIIEQEDVFDAPNRYRQELDSWWNGEFPESDERCFNPPPVVAWRNRLVAETEVPIIVVWHDERKQKGWVSNTENHRYCGISSDQAGTEQRWFPFINQARKAGTVVHGFGMTKPQWIRKYPFYSVDSSSWVSGERYGTTVLFQNGRLRHYTKDNKAVRKRFKNLFIKNGIDWEKLEAEDAWAVNQMNLLGWLLYADHVWKSPDKDYWDCEINGAAKDAYGPPRELTDAMSSDAAEVLESLGDLPPAEDDAEWDALDPKPKSKPPLGSNGVQLVTKKEPEKNQLRVLVPDIKLDKMERPTLFCNNCYVQDRCEFFEADASCHFKIDNAFASPSDMMEALRQVMKRQYHRTLHAELAEKLDGGVLDRNVSGEFDRMMNMLVGLHGMMTQPQETVEIKAKGGGAVSQILAALMPTKKKPAEVAGDAPVAALEAPKNDALTLDAIPAKEAVPASKE